MLRLKILINLRKKVAVWVSSHYLNLAVFNVLIVILVLLHSAKYFDPFWIISINAIIFLALIVSVFLLGARSKALFIISLIFWIFAGIMKILGINVWAERITVYMFESFLLGLLLLLIESFAIWKNLK